MAAYTKFELNSQLLSIFLPKIPLPPPDWSCIPITLLIGMRLAESASLCGGGPLRHPIFLCPTKTDYIALFVQAVQTIFQQSRLLLYFL